jgi:cytochrome c biogenesis factor
METLVQLITGQLQALCLSIGLLLSFVLPFTAKARALKDARNPKPWMRMVWAGQLLMALGGLFIIVSPAHPMFGFAIAIMSCVIFTRKLRRQLPVAHAS